MKFFTPRLLVEIDSHDGDVAREAHDQWEKATIEYQRHLRAISNYLPKSVYTVAYACLHDAAVLGGGSYFPEDPRRYFLLLRVLGDTEGYCLTYHLVQEPHFEFHQALNIGPEPLEWLYDEIDVHRHGDAVLFGHSILFSQGREAFFLCSDIELTKLKIDLPERAYVQKSPNVPHEATS